MSASVDLVKYYAPNDLVRALNMRPELTGADYVFQLFEVEEQCIGLLTQTADLFDQIYRSSNLNADISFAIVAGVSSPCRAIKMPKDKFVIILSSQYYLLLPIIIVRMQHAPVMHDFLGLSQIGELKELKGKYLIDIATSVASDEQEFIAVLSRYQSIFPVRSAWLSIIAHEITQIAHGHLDLLTSPDYKKFSEDDKSRWFTLRALEMDVDSSAIATVFNIIGIDIDREAEKAVDLIPSARLLLARQMHFGIFMYVIFTDTMSGNHFPKGHLTGYARYLVLERMCKIHLNQQDWRFHDIPELTRSAITETFSKISGSLESLNYPMAANFNSWDVDLNPFAMYSTEFVGKLFDDVMTPLEGRWASIRPYLEKYARGGKLAPAAANPC